MFSILIGSMKLFLDSALVPYSTITVSRDDMKLLLSQLSIKYVTTDQNSPGWFLMRSFSITSSAADGMIEELFRDFKCRQLLSMMIEWLKANLNERPYIFKTMKEMKVLLAERSDRPRYINAMTKAELLRELSGRIGGSDTGNPVARRKLWKRLLGRVLKATFMPKLVGKGKEYAKVGHKLEQPLLLYAFWNTKRIRLRLFKSCVPDW